MNNYQPIALPDDHQKKPAGFWLNQGHQAMKNRQYKFAQLSFECARRQFSELGDSVTAQQIAHQIDSCKKMNGGARQPSVDEK